MTFETLKCSGCSVSRFMGWQIHLFYNFLANQALHTVGSNGLVLLSMSSVAVLISVTGVVELFLTEDRRLDKKALQIAVFHFLMIFQEIHKCKLFITRLTGKL